MARFFLFLLLLFICLMIAFTTWIPVKQDNVSPVRQDTTMTDDSIPVVSLEKN